MDGLESRGAVDVGDAGDGSPVVAYAGNEEHEGGVVRGFEPLVGAVGGDTGGEGPEPFAELDFAVECVFHPGVPWVGEDGSVSEGAGAEFHASLEPSDDVLLVDQSGNRFGKFGIGEFLVDGVEAVEGGADFADREFGPPGGVLENEGAGVSEGIAPGVEGDAERASGVACSGLDEDSPEWGGFEDSGVGDTVEGDTPGEAEVVKAGLFVESAGEADHDVVGERLDGGREVKFALAEARAFGRAGRPSEKVAEPLVDHLEIVSEREVLHIQGEGSVVAEVDQFADTIEIGGLSVRRESHDLVFRGVDLEPEIVRKGAVEEAEGVGKADLVGKGDGVSASESACCGAPFADAVDGEDGGFVKGGDEEGGGSVAAVVFAEEDVALPVQVAAEGGFDPQLLFEHAGEGEIEGLESAGKGGQEGEEHAFEFDERFVVEGDVVDAADAASSLAEHVVAGMFGETPIVLLSGEAFLGGGGDEVAVAEECGRAVVVEG